ncbi:MAG: helix-turn-helix transcriptional regulator [Clostridia bacterium]|nr:helix-turn-helix transcriptional regulator [Clostridia bacterium]
MHNFFYDWEHDNGPEYFSVDSYRDLTSPLHMHRTFELIAVSDGTLKVHIEKQEYEMCGGDMLLVKSNFVHGIKTDGASDATICIFSPELIGASSPYFMKHPLTSPVVRNAPVVYWELLRGIDSSSTTGKIKGFLYSVCEIFYEQLDLTQADSPMGRNRFIREVLQYIEHNLQKPCALTLAAEELGCSASYLSRLFSTTVGISFASYVRSRRINLACNLLKNTNEKISEIMNRCGYTSIATFNHNFKEQIGCNPTEYRKQCHT